MCNSNFRIEKWRLVAVIAVVGMTAFPALVGRASEPRRGGGPAGAKVDPIEANGPIFVDWPKPDVALVFTGELDGYLEPCGCAGLDNQKGGLKRRFTFLKQLRDQGWPVVAMDLGGQENRSGIQAEIKLDLAYKALTMMNYAAVGFGAQDVRMDLLPIVINLDTGKNPLVSANVGIAGFDSGLTQRYKIVEAGGMKIGITSVLGKREIAGLKNLADVTLLEPYQAIPQVLPELLRADCDQLVLLAYAEPAEAQDLARRFHEFNWVAAAHGADEPPNVPAKIQGENVKSRLIEAGHKGMYVVVVGLYKDGPKPFRYQRVPLDARFQDAPEIHQLHVEYQGQLKALGWEGLGLKQLPHPSGKTFAGSEACADCHTFATEVHSNTPHAHAIETLAKLDLPRQFDPECISCHVIGWEPQKNFPFESGFVGEKETPAMVGNGCENCHGPAAKHVAAENDEIEASEEELEELRAALRLKVVENEGNKDGQVFGKVAQMCMTCHDLDNSPDFDFQTYWPEVEHEGKD